MPCISLTFLFYSRLLAGRELDLFYTFGILDERAHDNIGDAFCTLLFLLTGVFDSVLVYLNELFLTKKNTLHVGRCFFHNYPADAAPGDLAPTNADLCMLVARAHWARSHTRT